MSVGIHIDFQPLKECKHPEWTYGEICVKCGECGRFEKGGESNPIISHVRIIQQGHEGIPPFWRYPIEWATYFNGRWCRRDKKISEGGNLMDAMPECWHKRELEYVRWWIEGRNY